MATRIAVTDLTVKEYLDRTMTRDNYHLMYGLHLLSHERYLAVMDTLLNGDLQPEELVRLGGFSDSEADALLEQTTSGWTSSGVAVPSAGTTGYSYLTTTLGLQSYSMDPIYVETPVPPYRLAAAQIIVGRQGHANLDEVEAIFRLLILPAALNGLTVAAYIPATAAGVADLPVPNQNSARSARMASWLAPMLAPLIGADDNTLLRRIIPVANEECALREAPGLAEWLLRSPRPGTGTKLLLHREAASRSALGNYVLSELATMVDTLEATLVDHVGTPGKLTLLDFRLRLASAIAVHHFPLETALTGRLNIMLDALDGLYDHRDRLRGFIARVLSGCEQHLLGDYPPA
jgi:hypothetical protein